MSNVTRAGAADVGCVHEFEKKFVLLLIIFFNFPLEGSVGVSVCSLDRVVATAGLRRRHGRCIMRVCLQAPKNREEIKHLTLRFLATSFSLLI